MSEESGENVLVNREIYDTIKDAPREVLLAFLRKYLGLEEEL